MQRLTKRTDFVRISRNKQAIFTPGFILQFFQRHAEEEASTSDPAPRVGFTASRKVGNAVKRNFAKRRMRMLAQSILSVHARDSYDYVCVARAAILTRPFQQLEEDFRQAAIRLHQSPPRA